MKNGMTSALVAMIAGLIVGCQSEPMRDAALIRAASTRRGTIRIVAVDTKRQSAVIERELKTGDVLHDGKCLEEFSCTNGSWQCVGAPVH